jgi:hypothetical protein
MRGSLRVHSLTGFALLVGWSLLSHARERVAPFRSPPTAKTTAPRAAPPPEDRAPVVDTRVWN